jgi:TRAP transporter TAXI family solute receptor
LDGGVYDDFSGEIARRISRSHGVDATVVKSDGSLRNRQRLLEGALHLAPLQASTVRGEELCVVAPLFYEHVHVLVRPEAGIESIEAMAGRAIAVGPEGSGSRLAAELLFDSFGLTSESVDLLVVGWSDLEQLDRAEGAIVCMGTGSPLVTEMLRSGRFKLLEIPDALQVSADHPTLRPLRITSESYPDRLVPNEGVETVGMPAFLAARFDTPAVLVRAALDALYESPAIDRRMISRSVAAEFQGMQLHPEARRYFNQ